MSRGVEQRVQDFVMIVVIEARHSMQRVDVSDGVCYRKALEQMEVLVWEINDIIGGFLFGLFFLSNS